MSENKIATPILTNVIRYLFSFACVALGIYFCIAQTNGYIGATMAFSAAILLSPILDLILNSMHLKFGISYRAVLVIIAVAVDITTANMKFWLLINLSILLVFFILFLVLSNIGRKKQRVRPQGKALEKIEQPISVEESKPKQRKAKKPNRFKELFTVEDDEDEDEKPVVPLKRVEPKVDLQPNIEPAKEILTPQPRRVVNWDADLNKEEDSKIQPVQEIKKDALDNPASMVAYAIQHGYQQGADLETMKSCFTCILAAIKPEEKVLICFMGKNGGSTAPNQSDYYGYVITTKRLILGKLGAIEPIIQALSLAKAEKVTVTKGVNEGILHIHTTSGVLNIGMDNIMCQKIGLRIQRFIDEITRLKAKLAQEKRN